MMLGTVCHCLAVRLTYTHSKSDHIIGCQQDASTLGLSVCKQKAVPQHLACQDELVRESLKAALPAYHASCKWLSHLSIWIANLVPLVQYGIAPGDMQELVSL